MKFLLIAIAVVGLIYLVFIDSKMSEDKPDRPEGLHQKEVEKAKAVEVLLQDVVDERFDEMDLAR